MSELEAIKELMDGISPGVWDWTSHKREDGKPIESVEDVVAILALSARKGTGLELHGVGAKQCGEDIVVCYTGNGPRSAANARFLANAPSAIDWLTGEVARLTADLARVTGELERQKSRADGEYQSAIRYQKQRDDAEVIAAAEREKNAALTDKDKRWEKVAADLNARANENERALYAERARAKGMEKVLLEAEKWIDVRPRFDKSFIDTDYAREVLALADSISPSPAKEPKMPPPSKPRPIGPDYYDPPAVEKPCIHCHKEMDNHFFDNYQCCTTPGTNYEAMPAAEKPCDVCHQVGKHYPICERKPAVAPVESLTEDGGEKP